MNKSNKIKIILFASIGLIVVGLIISIVHAMNKGNSGSSGTISSNDTISVSVSDKFTYEDMMKVNESRGENYESEESRSEPIATMPSTSQEQVYTGSTKVEDTELKRMAAQIMANKPDAEPEPEKKQPVAPREQPTRTTANYSYTPAKVNKPRKVVSVNQEEEQEPEEAPVKRKLFFDSDDNDFRSASTSAVTVKAVVHGDQVLENNGSVKFRTTTDATINGELIPKNTLFYGTVSLGSSGNRMKVAVNSIKNEAVNWQVYDQVDGLAGLRIARQVNADATSDAIDGVESDALSTSGIYSVPVVGTLTRAASTLIKRKRSANTVVIATNYKVTIK